MVRVCDSITICTSWENCSCCPYECTHGRHQSNFWLEHHKYPIASEIEEKCCENKQHWCSKKTGLLESKTKEVLSGRNIATLCENEMRFVRMNSWGEKTKHTKLGWHVRHIYRMLMSVSMWEMVVADVSVIGNTWRIWLKSVVHTFLAIYFVFHYKVQWGIQSLLNLIFFSAICPVMLKFSSATWCEADDQPKNAA